MTYFEGQSELGNALGTAVERAAGEIEAICREIFDNPEPPLAEHRAAGLLTDYLRGLGYEVELGIAGLPTAFIARMKHHDSEAMRKGLRHGHVAVLAEYDGGTDGHTHGRHLIAGAALATAVGFVEVFKGVYGDVSIIGCPAASTGEGKRRLAAEGVFDVPDIIMGAAPASSGLGFQPTINSTGGALASAHLVARFAGDSGESDARQRLATAAEYLASGAGEFDSLRTTLAETGVEFDLTSETNAGLDALIAQLDTQATEVARETGSLHTLEVTSRTPAVFVNRILARRIKTFADRMGLKQDGIVKAPPGPPNDWGHASEVAATVRARYTVSEDSVEIGTEAFASACSTPFAYEQMISAALAVALTGLDVLGDLDFRGFAEGELIRTLNRQGVKREPRRWLGVHPVLPRNGAEPKPPALGPLAPPRRGRS